MKFILSFIITVVYCCNSNAQFTIANGLPGCLPVVNQEGIACGGGTTFFGVNGMNQFQVQNIDGINCCAGPGGDSGSYFEFDILNISDFMNINISMGYSASNTSFEDDSPGAPIFGCSGTIVDNSHDQIVFTYSINGGPYTSSPNFTPRQRAITTAAMARKFFHRYQLLNFLTNSDDSIYIHYLNAKIVQVERRTK